MQEINGRKTIDGIFAPCMFFILSAADAFFIWYVFRIMRAEWEDVNWVIDEVEDSFFDSMTRGISTIVLGIMFVMIVAGIAEIIFKTIFLNKGFREKKYRFYAYFYTTCVIESGINVVMSFVVTVLGSPFGDITGGKTFFVIAAVYILTLPFNIGALISASRLNGKNNNESDRPGGC